MLEIKESVSGWTRGGAFPSEISRQFNKEVLEKGLDLANHSRISHINFGRESYFGKVADTSGKSMNVHIQLNPETKVLKRASCGCFRSSTRSYCHHIVSFIRFILRPNDRTGGLRSLNDDFENSVWHDISWFGFKIYGDSPLGFKAEQNHGGEGLKISFHDRINGEILSFTPGERLVEEYLYEFFDIIRRDIDPVQFKRMYGWKLKDPNVPSQRRRPWDYTESEKALNKSGVRSSLQQHEESLWHSIAKVAYIIAGRKGGEFHFRFYEHKEELIIEGCDESDEVLLKFRPPRKHIGSIIELGENRDAIGRDLLINKRSLKTGYKIAMMESSDLEIIPVVENPDPDATPPEDYLDRTGLEENLYGKYYFFPDWGFFRISVSSSGLPPAYFSPQKTTIVPAKDINGFLEEYGETLAEEPAVFMDPELLSRETIDTYTGAKVVHKEFSQDHVSLNIDYEFGDLTAPLSQILDARRENRRYLVMGDKWIDAMSPDFEWLDSLEEDAVNPANELSITKAEYLRLLATHDRLKKRFPNQRLKRWFEGLEKLKTPGRVPSIKAMKGKLREYQRNGLGWLWFLYENGFSGLLCDDMGLGKTHQVMALMTAIKRKLANEEREVKFLVICPTTVLSHWLEKVQRYCPSLDPVIYHGTDRSFQEAFDEHSLIITSYGIALRDVETFAECDFELMVLDEAQAVKNKSTKTYAAIKALEARCMVGLTGTPIENSVTDLKSLFDIILPGYLFSDPIFDRKYRRPIEDFGASQPRTGLSRLINPFTLRRKKDQVLKELPPKIEDIRKCSLSDDQARLYKDIIHNQGSELVQTLKDPDKKVPYMHIFAVLNYLKQICDHPSLLEGESKDYSKYESGKWDLFLELLSESLGSGQKVVVFSQFVKMLQLIESHLKDQAIDFATIKGHTKNRAEAIKRFNTDPNCMVFTASLRASGLGIDLTGGSVVIHYDRWWNSAREEQATDRVHRIGQSRGVQVFKLVTENTLEEKIDSIISKKRELMENVVKEDDQALLKRFSREDLIELISF
jgi:SNF2 family DNA or RNA helicase